MWLAWGCPQPPTMRRPSRGVMVPTAGVRRLLEQRGFANLRDWTHGVDTQLFAFHAEPRECPGLGHLARPVSLFVGRLSHEKNLQAFLDLDIPGSKVVCGVGPLEQALREDDTIGITAAGERLTEVMDDVQRTHGIIGARARGMRDRLAQTETASFATEAFLSETRDLDYAEAATLFQQAQLGLQASMLTGSQVMRLSLLDFLQV